MRDTIELDMIERYLKTFAGANSLTLFRYVYGSDSEADELHRLWLKGLVIPLKVYAYCEAQLNEDVLENIRQPTMFDYMNGH